ncbi:uncharacterized protein ARMOST_02001 [Armillaria ostoyae]|uniref:Uncharacterized protein n=1 Tax=Armillaria ostoyae TaxID=47428 RepID=A0A284QQI0_ARMOS|nr:uncharacterized protein ARMOST_02001 [Armillaria ostoyae]
MGALCHAIFNFSPSARSPDIAIPHFPSLMTAMSKPAYLEYAPTKPVILFVNNATDLLLIHCALEDKPDTDRLEVADHDPGSS